VFERYGFDMGTNMEEKFIGNRLIKGYDRMYLL
jgi:hypothetical protein